MELGFDPRAASDFNLRGTASVHLHGVGGRTVQTLEENDLHVVRDLAPDIVILEIGTNDLSHALPQTVGSQIEEFVRLLQRDYSVRVIGVCGVIPRGISVPHAMAFLDHATLLNHYVSIVLEEFPPVYCWSHAEFNSPHKDLYLRDGVHVNPTGQYLLYRSYRGAKSSPVAALIGPQLGPQNAPPLGLVSVQAAWPHVAYLSGQVGVVQPQYPGKLQPRQLLLRTLPYFHNPNNYHNRMPCCHLRLWRR